MLPNRGDIGKGNGDFFNNPSFVKFTWVFLFSKYLTIRSRPI